MNTNEKLREAFNEISLFLQATSDVMCKEDKDKIELALDLCNIALAIPRRNCDVGTAVEQEERYIKLKREHVDKLTRCPAQGCSFFFPDSLYWAQMPYEEVK